MVLTRGEIEAETSRRKMDKNMARSTLETLTQTGTYYDMRSRESDAYYRQHYGDKKVNGWIREIEEVEVALMAKAMQSLAVTEKYTRNEPKSAAHGEDSAPTSTSWRTSTSAESSSSSSWDSSSWWADKGQQGGSGWKDDRSEKEKEHGNESKASWAQQEKDDATWKNKQSDEYWSSWDEPAKRYGSHGGLSSSSWDEEQWQQSSSWSSASSTCTWGNSVSGGAGVEGEKSGEGGAAKDEQNASGSGSSAANTWASWGTAGA